MIIYYTFMLFFVLLFQREVKNVLLTIITLIIVIFSEYLILVYTRYGYTFCAAAFRIDIIFVILSVFLYPLHKNKSIYQILLLSAAINYFYTVTGLVVLKQFIYNNYHLLNILLFEELLYNCVKTTYIYKNNNKRGIYVD